jgi:NarL family two-component system response regulator LiaR
MKELSVLLVDDHAVVRQGLASLLETTPDFGVIGEAADGARGIELARSLAPDIVVIDLLMPGVDGVTAIRSILTASPATSVVVLTSVEDEDLALSAIEAGAHAYLLKSMSGDELLAGMRRISLGQVVIHPLIAHSLLRALRRINQPECNPVSGLTEREMDVLRALGEGASNARLAETLNISEKTVKTHVSSILSKLGLGDRTEAVAFAWRHGLMGNHTPR